jgi:hypothetical protein
VKAEIADLEKMRAWSRKSGSIGMAAVALPDGFYLRSVYPTSPAAAAGPSWCTATRVLPRWRFAR